MRVIQVNTIAEAHESAIKSILEEHEIVNTKHGITMEYPEPLCITIRTPFLEPFISKYSKLPSHLYDEYKKQMLSVISANFDYNVGNRWFDYPQKIDNNIIGDGKLNGINQFEELKTELIKDNSSRRAMICSLNPKIDANKKHIPCITQLQFLLRGSLNLYVYMRSSDTLSALGADMYALYCIQQYVASELKVPVGRMEMILASSHIYYERDVEELKIFRKFLNR